VPDGLKGLDEGPVDLLACEGVAAAVGVVDVDRPLGRRADVIAHSRVLDALAAQGPVVPVRFGSVLAGESVVVEELLAPNADHLRQVLTDLAGTSQLTLQARYVEEVALAEIVEENPEIAELRQKTRDRSEEASYPARIRLGELVAAAMEAKRDIDGQAILEVLVPLAVDHRLRPGSGLDHLVEVAFLVADELRNEFEDAAEDLAAHLHGRVRLRLMGPVAPYDFVEEA
jgi:hypothetical protein